ncbi:MAG: ABC transporter substrate-binding protein [Acidaminococcaceae bacterium]
MKKYFVLICCVILGLGLVSGCGPQKQPGAQASQQAFFTMTDDNNRKVVLTRKPERVVVLSSSLFGMIDAVGGKVVGRVGSKNVDIPASMQDAPEVGTVTAINIEKIISLQPDCVFALKGLHDKFIPLLEANGVPVIMLGFKTYKDVQDKLELLGHIYGVPEQGKQIAADLDKKVAAVADKLPKQEKTIVIMHASAKNVTVELDNSIAGCVANLLHFKNVAMGGIPLSGSPDKTPYSLEELVTRNPEVIFITSMGDIEDIENRLRADVQNSPAWNSLQAVQQGRIYFLPEKLFLLNPGLDYPLAVQYMAQTVYPEVYAHEK